MPDLSLADIVSPLTEKEFIDAHWQQRTYHAAPRAPDNFSALITAGDIEATLPAQTAPSPMLVYAIDSRKSPQDSEPKDLYDIFQEGSTVKVDNVHRRFQPLNYLCRRLEEFFHSTTGANLYLTPPNSQGFRVHSDYEDVIVLQISGEKHWEIWPPCYPLPMRGHNTPVPREMPSPAETITLKAGESLYVPRGFPHRAYTREAASLHITIGIHTMLWIDLVIAAAKAAARRNTAFREALPAGFLRKGVLGENAQSRLRRLFAVLAEDPGMPAGLAELGKEVIYAQTMLRDNHFEVLCGIETLHADSLLRKRAGTVSFLEKTETHVHLHFAHKLVKLPVKVLQSLEFILASGVFAVKDIPGLNADSQLVLARRLVKDGYLTV
jgi:hypothetical protein